MITLAALTLSAQEQKPRHSRKPYLGAISKEPPSSFSFQCFEFALETPRTTSGAPLPNGLDIKLITAVAVSIHILSKMCFSSLLES